MVFALFEQFGMRYYDRIIMFGNPDDPYSDAEKGVDFESGVYGPPNCPHGLKKWSSTFDQKPLPRVVPPLWSEMTYYKLTNYYSETGETLFRRRKRRRFRIWRPREAKLHLLFRKSSLNTKSTTRGSAFWPCPARTIYHYTAGTANHPIF